MGNCASCKTPQQNSGKAAGKGGVPQGKRPPGPKKATRAQKRKEEENENEEGEEEIEVEEMME